MSGTISQARVSDSIAFFKKDFLSFNGLSDYSSVFEPTVFWGLYTPWDIEAYRAHQGVKVVLFAGADLGNAKNLSDRDIVINDQHMGGIVKRISNCRVIHHTVAIKDYSDYLPCPLGESIYCYQNSDTHGNRIKYGYHVAEALLKRYGTQVIVGYHGHSKSEMIDIYKSCYINIQPYPVPGYASALEMGHMGRQSISNRCNSFSIGYSSVDDIIRTIDAYAPPDVNLVAKNAALTTAATNWKEISQYKNQ